MPSRGHVRRAYSTRVEVETWPDGRPKMTKASRKRRLANPDLEGCPYCGHDDVDLDYRDLEPVEGGDVEQVVSCPGCGRRWKDVFRLAEVRELCD